MKRAALAPLLALLLLAADSRPRTPMLLISIDTLRADHLGCYGYAGGTSPNIDAFAQTAVRFTAAITPVPLTLPGHASLLSGLYPAHHGFRDNAFFRSDPQKLIAVDFRKAGYATAAFVSGAPLASPFGLAEGFDIYDDDFDGAERTADVVTDRAVRWIHEQRQPFFAWVHYFDPHAEYRPPPAYSRFADPYDGEIAFVDSQIPRLLEAAGKTAVVVLTADHGESLGEHGESTHGVFLYNATLHVPLLLRSPGLAASIRSDAVTLCDVAPTLLQLAGLMARKMDGTSLLSRPANRTLFAESLYASRNFGYAPLFAAIRDRHKYIRAPQPEFFDLASDPGEQHNIAKTSTTSGWASAANAYANQAPASAADPLPEDQADQLRSLGYIGGSLPAGKTDPKERIAAIEQFNRAMGALSRGENAAAELAFREVTRKEPKNALGFRFLGDALSAQGKYPDAARAYAASAALVPDPSVSVRLAKALFQSGSRTDAETTLKTAHRQHPGYEPVIFELASLYAALNRTEEALALLDQDTAETHNQRGILLLQTEPSRAETEFRAAIAQQQRPKYWNNLALALQRRHDVSGAEEAYRKALQMDENYHECEANLAFLLIQQQKWDDALKHLARLSAASPRLWNVRVAHAFVLEQKGRREEALQEYRAILAGTPADWPQRGQVESRVRNLVDQ